MSVFLLKTLCFLKQNDRLRGTVILHGVWNAFCLFLAPAQFLYSRATPIIWQKNAYVNSFLTKSIKILLLKNIEFFDRLDYLDCVGNSNNIN